MPSPNEPKRPVHYPKGITGPTIRVTDQHMPCGCKLDHDEDRKLRIYYCAPHAYAYEMVEALQETTKVIDQVVAAAPPEWDLTQAMEAGMKARRVLKKVKSTDWHG
jgi:hypothetical protein